MTLTCLFYPLFPTVYFEYTEFPRELQAFFSVTNRPKSNMFSIFSSIFREFRSRLIGLRKIRKSPWHNILCQGDSSVENHTKSSEPAKSSQILFVNINKLSRERPGYFLTNCHQESSAPSDFCSSFARCSWIFSAEAVRNCIRDCFTSSRAAWTASSVRARASSAYSLAT